MPIEIRELVVRARVEPGGERPESAEPKVPRAPGESVGQEELVQACVKEVLRILEEKRER